MKTYHEWLEHTLTLVQSRSQHHTKQNLSIKASLAEDFSREGGTGWSSNSAVFSHVEHEAKAKAYADLGRCINGLIEYALEGGNDVEHYTTIVNDLESALQGAKDRFRDATSSIAKALRAGLVPADQVGWVAHQARAEVLEEFLGTLKASSPASFPLRG